MSNKGINRRGVAGRIKKLEKELRRREAQARDQRRGYQFVTLGEETEQKVDKLRRDHPYCQVVQISQAEKGPRGTGPLGRERKRMGGVLLEGGLFGDVLGGPPGAVPPAGEPLEGEPLKGDSCEADWAGAASSADLQAENMEPGRWPFGIQPMCQTAVSEPGRTMEMVQRHNAEFEMRREREVAELQRLLRSQHGAADRSTLQQPAACPDADDADEADKADEGGAASEGAPLDAVAALSALSSLAAGTLGCAAASGTGLLKDDPGPCDLETEPPEQAAERRRLLTQGVDALLDKLAGEPALLMRSVPREGAEALDRRFVDIVSLVRLILQLGDDPRPRLMLLVEALEANPRPLLVDDWDKGYVWTLLDTLGAFDPEVPAYQPLYETLNAQWGLSQSPPPGGGPPEDGPPGSELSLFERVLRILERYPHQWIPTNSLAEFTAHHESSVLLKALLDRISRTCEPDGRAASSAAGSPEGSADGSAAHASRPGDPDAALYGLFAAIRGNPIFPAHYRDVLEDYPELFPLEDYLLVVCSR